MQQGEEKRGKVKKGWLAVRVDEDQRRFVIPIAYLYHPLFRRLLEAAREAYGYHSSGPLRLPCSVDEFLRLRALVERDNSSAHSSSSSSSHRMHLAPCTRAKVTS
jgi:SAUR family protein